MGDLDGGVAVEIRVISQHPAEHRDVHGTAHVLALLDNEALRRRMVARGLARAAAFDVATMGRSLLEWYERALELQKTHD